METPQRTTGETIFQAITDLHTAGRVISRQALEKSTGLKLSIIDDHVKRLKDLGRLRPVVNGVFELVEQFPSNRRISKTVLADGLIEVEVGDQVLELYPSEAHKLGQMFMGEAMQYASLQGERDVQDVVARMESQLTEARNQLRDARQRLDEMGKKVAKLQDAAQRELSLET